MCTYKKVRARGRVCVCKCTHGPLWVHAVHAARSTEEENRHVPPT